MTEISTDASAAVIAAVPRAHAARAEVARLSLAVRVARHAAERREREASDLDELVRRAEVVLDESFTQAIEDRRHALEQALEAERQAAAHAIGEARESAARALEEQAARRQVEPEPTPPSPPAPPLRLRVVGGPAEPDIGPSPSPEAAQIVEAERVVDGSESLMVGVSEEQLRAVVHAAVTEGLREAIEQAAATMHLVPALASGAAPSGRPSEAPGREEIVDERPRWRPFLYLDVLLPLLAALIVLVLFLAWIG